MQELSLDKFNPKKAEITALAEGFKSLVIKGIDDIDGYEAVYSAKQKLKSTRVEIEKQGKAFRAEAVDFQRNVISLEKQLVKLLKPVELGLADKLRTIDDEKEKIARLKLLPDRKAKLAEIDAEYNEEEISMMDSTEFQTFRNVKYSEFLARKEEKQKVEQEKIDAEKRKIDKARELEEAKKKAEKDAQDKALRDAGIAKQKAEQEKIDAVETEKKKGEAAKQALLAEQKAEKDILEAKQRAELKAEKEKRDKEKAEAESLKNKKEFKGFLVNNGYREETKDQFHLKKEGNLVTLYKKVSEFIIK